jgi:hypothetical protein
MCRAAMRPMAFILVAMAFAVLIGCPRRVPYNGGLRSHLDFKGIARRAIAQFDTNRDGVIQGAELDKCPELKAALDRLDPNGRGAVTAEMIAARIEAWDKSRLGRMFLECSVTHNGKPLEGALVKFVPEAFLGFDDPRWTASGKTDKDGRARISVPVSGDREDPPGVPPGFYRAEITKPRDKIPAKYNTQTILGQEVAIDAKGIEESIKFDLDY